MEVIKYLQSGKTLEDLELEYHIEAKIGSNGVVSLNYNQIYSDMSLPICRECRSLLVENGTWNIVARSFYKFFNAGESKGADIEQNFDWGSMQCLSKIDGCCDETTLIETINGVLTIKDICDNKIVTLVKSYNVILDIIEYDLIIGHSIKDNNDDWYEIELENNIILKLTGNHRIFLPELNCYRKVIELEGNELLLVEKIDS